MCGRQKQAPSGSISWLYEVAEVRYVNIPLGSVNSPKWGSMPPCPATDI